MFDTAFDAATGALLTLAVMFLIVGITLYRGRRLEQLRAATTSRKQPDLRGKTQSDLHPEQADDIALEEAAEPAPHQRPGWSDGARQVRLLLQQCQRHANTHDHLAVQCAAEAALSRALKQLAPDHFLVAFCLDWLGYAEMCQGRHYNALQHLSPAAAILSEWPQHDGHLRNGILPRIATCRQILGFQQDEQ